MSGEQQKPTTVTVEEDVLVDGDTSEVCETVEDLTSDEARQVRAVQQQGLQAEFAYVLANPELTEDL